MKRIVLIATLIAFMACERHGCPTYTAAGHHSHKAPKGKVNIFGMAY